MHRKRSLLHRASSSRLLCASSSSASRPRSFNSLDCKTRAKGVANHDKARGSNIRLLEIQNSTYRIQTIGTIRASSSYQVNSKVGTSQIHDSRLQNTFTSVSDEELIQRATVEKDELASRELERRERERRERSRISLGEEASSASRNRNKIPDRRPGKGNTANSRGKLAVTRDLEQRTVLLTPWRGAPTFLHAVAFIKELEKRYGKIQWCHLWRDEANPYEYNASIIVVFESPASLRKMPGLSFPPNDLSATDYQANSNQNDDQFDMGPSTSLDPTANPATQDMLRRIQVESEKLQQKGKGKASSSIGENPISPLFMPWSEKLDEKALMKGGPGLEDVLPFLQERNLKEKDVVQGKTEDGKSTDGTSVDGPIAQKATWTEYDEPINIDAVVRKWETGRVYLPKPRPPQPPYFKGSTRLNIAQAFVDFGGFSEEPADTMKAVLRDWRSEANAAKAGVWMPYDEQVVADEKMLKGQEEESLEQDDHWDLFPVDAWVVNETITYGRDEEKLLPKPVYQRIGEDPELEEDEDPWEGLGTHPLQFPNSVAKPIKKLKPTTPASSEVDSTASELLESGQNASKSAKTDTTSTPSKSQAWDTWRTDPRPFRNGLGRDDPRALDSEEQPSKPTTGVRPKPWQWTKPGLGSSTAQQQSAMRAGSHSHSNSVRDWAKDKRGRKMKRREDGALERFGVSEEDLTGGVTPPTQSDWDTWGEKEEKAKKEEQRINAEKDLKARLRAILDGTNVH